MNVYRKNGKTWKFEWKEHGWEHKDKVYMPKGWYYQARKHLYRVMIENTRYKQIWIGQIVQNHNKSYSIITVEAYPIYATKIDISTGKYLFND